MQTQEDISLKESSVSVSWGILTHLCYRRAVHNRYRYRLIFDACEQMDKEYVVYINNGVLFNYKERYYTHEPTEPATARKRPAQGLASGKQSWQGGGGEELRESHHTEELLVRESCWKWERVSFLLNTAPKQLPMLKGLVLCPCTCRQI